jgi:hypothetical protein
LNFNIREVSCCETAARHCAISCRALITQV